MGYQLALTVIRAWIDGRLTLETAVSALIFCYGGDLLLNSNINVTKITVLCILAIIWYVVFTTKAKLPVDNKSVNPFTLKLRQKLDEKVKETNDKIRKAAVSVPLSERRDNVQSKL